MTIQELRKLAAEIQAKIKGGAAFSEMAGVYSQGRNPGGDWGWVERSVLRKELAQQHPWLPAALFKAFSESKARALELLADTSATKVTLPFVEEQLKAARETLGEDFWAYGVGPSRRTLEAFTRHHFAQGLSARKVEVEELFDPSTYESYSI